MFTYKIYCTAVLSRPGIIRGKARPFAILSEDDIALGQLVYFRFTTALP